MKKFLSLLTAFLIFIAVANAQTRRRTTVHDAHDRYPSPDTLDLVKAKNNRSGNVRKPPSQTADSAKKTQIIPQKLKTNNNSFFIERKVL